MGVDAKMQEKNDWTCFVCDGETTPYFSKDFDGRVGLGIADYFRCKNCGLVFSKTHLEMTQEEWEFINMRYHWFFGHMENADDPQWRKRLYIQARTIAKLADDGILSKDLPWIDYGCGDGKLTYNLSKRNLTALKFDRYLSLGLDGYLAEEDLLVGGYDVVINTSVFEHVRTIEVLDEIAGLVSENGALALHVMVREEIPQDPDWDYLLPAHCTFFTNKSMRILFERWGFQSSIYHPVSRMWFWFKQNNEAVETLANSSNKYYFKRGFVDYWK